MGQRPTPRDHALVRLQRLAGNHAVVTLARQSIPDEPLDAGQVTKALEFYRVQPWLYTPAVLADLRTRLSLPAGGIDADLVQAVARFQRDNIADPSLTVDGMAGPRSTPRLFPAGLARAGEGTTFGGAAQAVFDQWDTLATADARARALIQAVNARLADARVPALTVRLDNGGSPNEQGSFAFETWTMHLNRRLLEMPGLDHAGATELANTVYHEARHAEQWFAMARLRAGVGRSAAGIVEDMGIPARIAQAARRIPIRPGTTEAVSASGWFESVYGAGAAAREGTLRRVEAADFALATARCRAQLHPSARADELVTQAQARFDIAHDAYQELPEENDAFATESTSGVGDAIMRGTANPQAVPDDDPCDQLRRARRPLPGPA